VTKKFSPLYEVLGYTFEKPALLRQALTHRSFNKKHNERLEFLGDSVLNFVITTKLYELHPTTSEGDLTRMRARLVRGVTLAEIGRELDIGPFLLLGPGELKSGGRRRQSIIADTVEAIIGALYCEAGLPTASGFILRCYESRLSTLSPDDPLKDPKTQLQEWCQGHQSPLPAYSLEKTETQGLEQVFYVDCVVTVITKNKPGNKLNECTVSTKGVGSSRRRAEQSAAEKALAKLVTGA